MGRTTAVIQADVSKIEEIERLVKEAESALGRIDILVNNAGIQRRALLYEMTIEDWNQVIQINLNVFFFISQQVANRMILRKKKKIMGCQLIKIIRMTGGD